MRGARTLAEWHEGWGPVVWWRFPAEEPCYIGSPLDKDWPGYHTHWTPHPPVPSGALRLQLSRRKGFNLQALSRAINGLPAINCARPGPWGNLWIIGLLPCSCREAQCDCNSFRRETAAEAVFEHEKWLAGWKDRDARLAPLRDHNLACWCAAGSPCHVDNYLRALYG